jgi:Gas vesicle synthesis protein GvpL/GvpF
VIEVYAITDHPGPPLPDVAPLREVPCEGLAAVCAPAEDAPVTADALWRHEEVVEALMDSRDLLPVRFGTRLPDEEAAERALMERRGELATALDKVRCAVELSLRVHAAPPPGDAASGPAPTSGAAEPAESVERDEQASPSGREYILARAQEQTAREEKARSLHQPLSLMARDSVSRRPRDAAEVLRAAYLVERPDVDRFAALVERLQLAHPELQLLCTGPWPPYSFAAR